MSGRRVFRVCRATHSRLDGEGGRRVGGRWNSPGRRAVYMAESISLAVLENLVHMSRADFPTGYVSIAATIPDSVAIATDDDPRKRFGDIEPSRLGDLWLDGRISAVLRVRSVVVRTEFNYVLNPVHPDFDAITAETPVPFQFDERLFRTVAIAGNNDSDCPQQAAISKAFPAKVPRKCNGMAGQAPPQRPRRPLIEENPHRSANEGGLSRLRLANSMTSSTCVRSTPANQSTMSSIFAPASRFSKMVMTGMRLPFRTHAPLTLPGTLSTAGHCDRSMTPAAFCNSG